MRSLHNIEPSAFHKGEYVGYAGDVVWAIVRSSTGWRAFIKGIEHSSVTLQAPTFERMSIELNKQKGGARG